MIRQSSNIIIFFLISLIPLASFAWDKGQEENDSASIEQRFDYVKLLKRKDINVNYLILSYGKSDFQMAHFENSNNSNFRSINRENNISRSSLDLSYGHEFKEKNYISFMALIKYGRGLGSERGSNNNLFFREKLNDKEYGPGLGINLNGKAFKLKIVPFFSSLYIIRKQNYSLTASTNGNDNFSTIEQEASSRLVQNNFGIRFIDNSKNMMSYLAIGRNIELSNDTKNTAKANNSEVNITNNSSPTNNKIFFTIGVGFLF